MSIFFMLGEPAAFFPMYFQIFGVFKRLSPSGRFFMVTSKISFFLKTLFLLQKPQKYGTQKDPPVFGIGIPFFSPGFLLFPNLRPDVYSVRLNPPTFPWNSLDFLQGPSLMKSPTVYC